MTDTLEDRLADGKPLPLDHVARFGMQMAAGLSAAHSRGMIHRDVKPSNCVRKKGKEFCMVDFGLSKSIVVGKGSSHADPNAPFSETQNYRREREKADFRGTSMYASLRVHQLKDYCPRDDMWSVMYVFCDLVSGGLPWMSHAAHRDREACEKMKAEIHSSEAETYRMLMGEKYHVTLFQKTMMEKRGNGRSELQLPKPLDICKDTEKVSLLWKAFSHLSELGFTSMPDYDLIRDCLLGFLKGPRPKDDKKPMDWADSDAKSSAQPKKRKRWDDNVPSWDMKGVMDPIDGDWALWEEAESYKRALDESGGGENAGAGTNSGAATGIHSDASDFAKLPVELQFRIAQMEYHKRNSSITPKHIALRDWMRCALPLVYGTWDVQRFERGSNRTTSDQYRREVFLKVVRKCLDCAETFTYFSDKSFYVVPTEDDRHQPVQIESERSIGSKIAVSRVLAGLESAKAREQKKMFVPPPAISFSQSSV